MKISKEGAAKGGDQINAQELEIINTYCKAPLKAEEVYTFSLILCDNDIDRDFEKFSLRTLKELSELFAGKTGITDHEWKAENQIARIYRTEIVTDFSRKTADGEDYVCLKAMAYMLRTEENARLIAEINGGIKKETSVGCSVAESRCSICGEIMGGGKCSHIKGEKYGGRLCCAILEGAVDAYEWSFVAVPAQRNAGVTKGLDVSKGLKGFVETKEGSGFAQELEELRKGAALGGRYLQGLKKEAARLALICDRELYKSLAQTIEHLDADTLEGIRAAFEKKAAEMLPLCTQLPGTGEITRFDGGEYLI